MTKERGQAFWTSQGKLRLPGYHTISDVVGEIHSGNLAPEQTAQVTEKIDKCTQTLIDIFREGALITSQGQTIIRYDELNLPVTLKGHIDTYEALAMIANTATKHYDFYLPAISPLKTVYFLKPGLEGSLSYTVSRTNRGQSVRAGLFNNSTGFIDFAYLPYEVNPKGVISPSGSQGTRSANVLNVLQHVVRNTYGIAPANSPLSVETITEKILVSLSDSFGKGEVSTGLP